MNTRIVFSVIVLGLGLTAAMLPSRRNDSIALNERELLQEMLLKTNYLTPDEVADLLIAGDPSIQLIDVRPASEFKDGLPRAINIPLDSLFSESYAYVFDQLILKNVIYGMDDRQSTQLWMITKQMGFRQNYLMKGGLEAWNKTILDPQYPDQTAPQSDFDLYARRMACRQYFTGAKSLPQADIQPIAPVQGRKKKRVQGGCS